MVGAAFRLGRQRSQLFLLCCSCSFPSAHHCSAHPLASVCRHRFPSACAAPALPFLCGGCSAGPPVLRLLLSSTHSPVVLHPLHSVQTRASASLQSVWALCAALRPPLHMAGRMCGAAQLSSVCGVLLESGAGCSMQCAGARCRSDTSGLGCSGRRRTERAEVVESNGFVACAGCGGFGARLLFLTTACTHFQD
jgi:hypothetical protein